MFDHQILDLLLFIFEHKTTTFGEMKQKVLFNSRTLSKKLKYLQNKDLVSKKMNIYNLTQKGHDFYVILQKALNILDKIDINFEKLSFPFLMRQVLFQYIFVLQDEFGDELEAIVLFGSYSTGKFDDRSDIDLFILHNSNLNYLEIFKRFVICRRKIRQKSEYRNLIKNGGAFRVQHVPFSTKNVDNFHNLFPDLITTGIALYDPNKKYNRFQESVKTMILERGLIKVTDIKNNHYWRRIKMEE